MYEAEAALRPKVWLNSPRVAMFSEVEQSDRRYANSELLKDKRDITAFQVEKYQQAL